jgi:hypothetical protein
MKSRSTGTEWYTSISRLATGMSVAALLLLVLVRSRPVQGLLVERNARHNPGDVKCATALARFYLREGMFGSAAPGPEDKAALRERRARAEHVLQVLSEVPEENRNAAFYYWRADGMLARYVYGEPKGDRRLRLDAAQALDQALSVGSGEYRQEVNAWLHYARGALACDGADYGRALREAEIAMQLQPSQPTNHLLLFEARIGVQKCSKNRDRHRIEAALADFQPWLEKLNNEDRKEAREQIKLAHDLLGR